MRRLGLFGGSFTPVHLAHIKIAEAFTEQLQLDKCLFIPANISPFKTSSESSDIIKIKHRLGMLEAAIKGNKKFEIETYELEKGGISYTYETISYIKGKYPKDQLFLLIGSDQTANFTKWKNWHYILECVQICIANRPNTFNRKEFTEYIKKLSLPDKEPILISSPLMDISSTEIRRRIKSGLSMIELLPEEVEEYLKFYLGDL